MVLVDSNIWISHFRKTNKSLVKLLDDQRVVSHPYILLELAMGHIKQREEALAMLDYLPKLGHVSSQELRDFIELKKLQGAGIGVVDATLLHCTLIAKALIWTMDKSLLRNAENMGCAYGG